MLVKKIQSHWATTVKFSLVLLSQILTQSKTTRIMSVTGLETSSNVHSLVFPPFLCENVRSLRRYRKQEEVFNHISKLRYASRSLKELFRYLEIWLRLSPWCDVTVLHWTASFSPRKEQASTVNHFSVKLRLATTCRKDREILWPQAYEVRHGWYEVRHTAEATTRRFAFSCCDDVVSCGRVSILWSSGARLRCKS